MKELTREDLMQALRVCVNQDCYSYNSVECPLHAVDNCVGELKQGLLAVLERDETEIRTLKAEVERLNKENFWLTNGNGVDGLPRPCGPRNDGNLSCCGAGT